MTHHNINLEAANETLHRAMVTELPLEYERIRLNGVDRPAPAVVVLHGRGANERDLLPLAEELPGDFDVISLRAPTQLGPGYTWYDLDLSGGGLHASEPDPDDWVESLDLIQASIDIAIDEFDLDPNRIALLGFSQGAIMSLGLMIEQPGRFAWIAALHGYLPAQYDRDDVASAAGTPVFLAAGSEDQIIPATRAEEAHSRLSEAGVDTTYRVYEIGHGTSPDELADLREWVSTRG